MADKSNGPKIAPEDMTPVPTQEQLDGVAGKDQKREPRKAPEILPPTPTQAELDETKAKICGMEVPKRREAKETAAKDAEDLTPTPTQTELDAAKKAAMYEPEDSPGGGTDPQRAQSQTQRRQVEAKPAAGGYQTRAVAPESVKTE